MFCGAISGAVWHFDDTLIRLRSATIAKERRNTCEKLLEPRGTTRNRAENTLFRHRSSCGAISHFAYSSKISLKVGFVDLVGDTRVFRKAAPKGICCSATFQRGRRRGGGEVAKLVCVSHLCTSLASSWGRAFWCRDVFGVVASSYHVSWC